MPGVDCQNIQFQYPMKLLMQHMEPGSWWTLCSTWFMVQKSSWGR